ncbi:phosphatidylinositol transfer protein beta isoform-like isoform X2 [Takifugu rubripes]|uniref:phosphatidylinositol transfer protein beta isoform-like isoform X2 n=1 Tax=Takifugu rubripes TaxID=31033 RepID=UPI0011459CE0|nr:phosphatidylinositol transfer protein beta isoform-like isoform X2 [Takifugu rubripes]
MGWLRGPLTQTDMMGWNLKCPLVYVSSSVGITNVEEELAPLADFALQWPLAVLHTNSAVSKGVDRTPPPQTRRVILPCSVEEYQVGQLFSVAEASKNETGGGDGIQVLKNEPYEKDGEKGQFTHKVYHIKSKVPAFLRVLAPENAFIFHEKAWNAYPYCKTVVTNEFMEDDFFINIETWHKPDLGTQENVHKLDSATWKKVVVVPIDIADRSQVSAADYKPEEDPAHFKSVKTGRGPLGPSWTKELLSKSDCPRMCAYKLVTVKFKWWGLQTKVENLIHEQERRIFTNFHRQLFCTIDRWVELTMDDIRKMEAETQKELELLRLQGKVRGTSAADS